MTTRCVVLLTLFTFTSHLAAAEPAVSFKQEAGKVDILIGGQPFATYVYQDEKIPRPFFRHLRAPGGVQVTRNQPPVVGDLSDHALFHPGVWLAFGDISGSDCWRVRAPVKHEKFLDQPKGGAGRGAFSVVNLYLSSAGKTICRETCRYTVSIRPAGYLLFCDSEFASEDGDFAFGDQEEMGFGVRVATPLNVSKGGKITNSDGLVNEPKAWGKQADWCDYSGTVGGQRVGVVLMPSPTNFRRSWFHVRDYGLMCANPFGQSAFRAGPKSQVVVKKGEKLTLAFGVLCYRAAPEQPIDLPAAYQDFLKTIRKP